MRSKWKPSLIISIQADTEELQDKELRKKILGSYTDTTEAGEPWLIPAGEIDIKTVQPLTLKRFSNTRQYHARYQNNSLCDWYTAFYGGCRGV